MIFCDEKKNLFTLSTRNTSYQMKADEHRVLLHTYYGARLDGEDMSYLIQYADRGFSPNPNELGDVRDYSLDTLPQEYSSCGVGDFRLPSIEFEPGDGSRLADLRYTGYEVRAGKYSLPDLPAFFGSEDEWQTLVIFLRDAAAGMEVELYYGVHESCDLITRAVRVVNRSEDTVRLRRCASLCLDFRRGDMDFITFDGCHLMERCPGRAPLRRGIQSAESMRGASSHHHNPFVVLCEHGANEDWGLCCGAMLVYSGSFQAAAERTQLENNRLVMGIHPYNFCWTLAPGEAFTAPEAALVCSTAGLGEMSRCFHRALRRCLIRDPYEGARRPVLINNWEATQFDFDADKLVSIAEAASDLGMELFVMDDGWFGSRDSDLRGLGDWEVNTKKLPGGLEALVPRIKALGMSFGLWVEPEMVSEDSRLYREHPDWALGAPNRPQSRGRSQLVLDFSRAEVREHIYQALRAVLESEDITYLKWDMNRSLSDVWSAAVPAERQGEVFHRFVLGVYEVLERLRQNFPSLLIEGCCGGGGRFDAGMLYYTPQIWCSDNTDAADRLRIQYGTSFAYPVSAMGAHVSAVPNEQTGRSIDMSTRGVVAMHGTFGYEMDLRRCTAGERDMVRAQTQFFKDRFGLISGGDYYRLADPFADEGFTAWEHVSPDGSEALVSIVSLSARGAQSFSQLRLKGLREEALYRVDGGERLISGRALMEGGWPIPIFRGDYQAMQIYLKAE